MDPYEEARQAEADMKRTLRGLDEEEARMREDARRVARNMKAAQEAARSPGVPGSGSRRPAKR